MRKLLTLLAVAGVVGLSYYLFFRPFEFEVKLNAKTHPGDLIGTIRIWNRSLDSAAVIEVDSLKRLKQNIKRNGRNYIYDWHFKPGADSLTRISVKISEPDRALLNKLLIPFTDQSIESDASDIMRNFHRVLKEHLEITRVKVIGEAELEGSFCVCKEISTSQIEKANGMMRDYAPLTAFIHQFNIETNGPPMVRVRNWNHSKGLLNFDFCFPIVKRDSLPDIREFKFLQFERQRALKAEFFGNYITSDRAWYELIQYAEDEGYKLDGFPVERFHNNPTLGLNERNWKAEIYLPIK
jgi:effector-binding domain-containing protein